MIIFTEHNEVIMSVDDMRNLIRKVYEAGWRNAHSPAFESTPLTFAVEKVLQIQELKMRQTREV